MYSAHSPLSLVLSNYGISTYRNASTVPHRMGALKALGLPQILYISVVHRIMRAIIENDLSAIGNVAKAVEFLWLAVLNGKVVRPRR